MAPFTNSVDLFHPESLGGLDRIDRHGQRFLSIRQIYPGGIPDKTSEAPNATSRA